MRRSLILKRALPAALLVAAVAVAVAVAETKPDPNVQARPDGCQRDGPKIYTGFAPNWVYVGDASSPADAPPPAPRWASGTIASRDLPYLAARVATSDDPITHRSFDVNIDLRVDGEYDALTGLSRDTTSERGTIHLERESEAYPSWTWGAPGDRLTALGSWVWDCDHFTGRGEKTEFHPFRATWLERNPGQPSSRSPRGESEGDLFVSTEGTPAAIVADCAHRMKASPAFKDCLHSTSDWQDVNGDYSFQLSPPPRPSRGSQLVVRVVDRGSVNAPPVNAVFNDAAVKVSFAVNAPRGQKVVVAKQVFAGWKDATRPVHLRLRFDSVLIRRAMDPSCRPDQPDCPYAKETTLLGQIADAPGEYQLTWSVAGTWGSWSPRTLRARDGQRFPGRQIVDFWVPSGRPWQLVAEARECDFGALPSFAGPGVPMSPCPRTNEVGNATGDDYAGGLVARFASLERSLGRHSTNSVVAGSSCPPSNVKGCYQLTYTVSRVR